MIGILNIEGGLYVLSENGLDILSSDCVRFGITRNDKKFLLNKLKIFQVFLQQNETTDEFIRLGIIKKLTKQWKAVKYNLWEARDEGSHGRVIFCMLKPDMVIISAVNKVESSLSQAINRGVKRWELYLKTSKK